MLRGEVELGSCTDAGEDVSGGNLRMSVEPVEFGSVPIPLSYEQCVAKAIGPKADFVVSPLEMVMLFDWDEDE